MSTPTIWLSDKALAEMLREASRAHPDETGGMLLGWSNPSRNESAIALATGPGPRAVHRPTSFNLDGEWQQEQLDLVYLRTDGRLTFLGDWHVHPSGGLGLSRRDRRTLALTARDSGSRCPSPLSVLLARRSDAYELAAWRWTPSRWPLGGQPSEVQVKRWRIRTEDRHW